jgi:WD40 repeat protein
VLNVAYSADGDYLVMSDKSENLRLVDVRNGKNKIIASVSYDKEYWVNEVAWHGKDSLLMCAGRQKTDVQEKGIVQLIKVEWGQGDETCGLKSVGSVVAHTANCTNIAMDATRQHFATGAYDGTVCIWDAVHLACLRPACTTLEEAVGCLSFSHDSVFLAATMEPEGRNAAAKKMLDISLVDTGETVYKLEMKVHAKKMAWHPQQHIIAFAGEKYPGQVTCRALVASDVASRLVKPA